MTTAARHITIDQTLDAEIARRAEAYYTHLYRDEIGHPDWQHHVAKRRDEDQVFRGILERTERWVIGRRIEPPSRVLVVGGGTGADFMAFAKQLRPLLLRQHNQLLLAAPWGPHP